LGVEARPKALSLFSGAGGMDIGLEAAGFDTVGCVEIDTLARETLRLNRPDWNLLTPTDVIDFADQLSPASIGLGEGDLSLLAGGPPCQPFSTAAQWSVKGRSGMRDRRASTVHAFLLTCEKLLPAAITIENVIGFVSGKDSALLTLTEGLEGINFRHGTRYELGTTVVDAADYGVPQRRRRAILTAHRDGLPIRLPPPSHAQSPVTAWDALHDLDPGELPSPRGQWTELLGSIPEGGNYQFLTARGGGEELFGYRTKFWSFLLKLAKDQPSWTLPASPGPSTGPFHWDNRPLSISEMARLQTFPQNWQFKGSYRESVQLVGNATPALLAEIVGRAILSALGPENSGSSDKPVLQIAHTSVPLPLPLPPRPVPARYRGLVGAKLAHPGTGLGPGRVGVP
jgi:DNA (cytosine-5)-methyltransferase 1